MRLIAGAITLALLTVSVGAQTLRLRDVVARLDGYLEGYEHRLANVVAEEAYRQWVEQGPTDRRSTMSRMLRSDFALTLTPERSRWVGYRDTFDVDGVPVRDREERLQRLLSSGAVGQAARVAEQNARFNLGDGLISRNINIPTFALEVMNPRFRDRVKVRRTGADVLEGRPGWLIEFREQDDLTLVRSPKGGDQASRAHGSSRDETASVNPRLHYALKMAQSLPFERSVSAQAIDVCERFRARSASPTIAPTLTIKELGPGIVVTDRGADATWLVPSMRL